MNRAINFLVSRSNLEKRSLIIVTDLFLIFISLWVALSLEQKSLYSLDNKYLSLYMTSIIIALPVFIFFDLYRSIIRFMGFTELWSIVKGVTLLAFISYFINSLIQGEFYSLTLFFFFWLLCITLISTIRLSASSFLLEKFVSSNVIIYGAGAAGRQLSSALRHSSELKPIAFIDEDKSLQGNFLNGIKVLSPSKLAKLIKRKNILEVLIAIPSAKRYEISRIVSSLSLIHI